MMNNRSRAVTEDVRKIKIDTTYEVLGYINSGNAPDQVLQYMLRPLPPVRGITIGHFSNANGGSLAYHGAGNPTFSNGTIPVINFQPATVTKMITASLTPATTPPLALGLVPQDQFNGNIYSSMQERFDRGELAQDPGQESTNSLQMVNAYTPIPTAKVTRTPKHTICANCKRTKTRCTHLEDSAPANLTGPELGNPAIPEIVGGVSTQFKANTPWISYFPNNPSAAADAAGGATKGSKVECSPMDGFAKDAHILAPNVVDDHQATQSGLAHHDQSENRTVGKFNIGAILERLGTTGGTTPNPLYQITTPAQPPHSSAANTTEADGHGVAFNADEAPVPELNKKTGEPKKKPGRKPSRYL